MIHTNQEKNALSPAAPLTGTRWGGPVADPVLSRLGVTRVLSQDAKGALAEWEGGQEQRQTLVPSEASLGTGGADRGPPRCSLKAVLGQLAASRRGLGLSQGTWGQVWATRSDFVGEAHLLLSPKSSPLMWSESHLHFLHILPALGFRTGRFGLRVHASVSSFLREMAPRSSGGRAVPAKAAWGGCLGSRAWPTASARAV